MIPMTMKKITRQRTARGFTLIELLLVMMIIAILAAVVVPRLTGNAEKARVIRAKADIVSLNTAIKTYEIQNGTFPTNEQGLTALIANPGSSPNWTKLLDRATVPVDPWGHPYIYHCPSANGTDFDLYSLGPDGVDGAADNVKLD
jgi:general secretion pathway protein G